MPPPAGFTAPTPGLRGGLLCAAVPPKRTRSFKDASSFKLLDMSTKRRKAHLNKLAASKRQAQTADVAAVNLPLFAESKANQRCGKTETK